MNPPATDRAAGPYPVAIGAVATPRKAYRDLDGAIIGGVAMGLARHFGCPSRWVRAAFAFLTIFGGMGVAMYGGLWLMLPAAAQFEQSTPGLESASRGGRRPGRIRRIGDLSPIIVLTALGLGAIFFVEAAFGRGAILWPLVIGAAGIALLWRQADEAQRERWLDTSDRIDPIRMVLGDRSWAAYGRLAAGVILVGLSLLLLSLRGGSLSLARDVALAGLLGVVGIGIVVGPWIVRLVAELGAERAERVRSQERADVAAHLHDSVLQTLALIQKNADDAAGVSKLARSQERDLRAWLYSAESMDDRTVASALRSVAAEIEDTHGLKVVVVSVGDCDLTEELRPIVAATREALTNVAKHAQVADVDVYAEIISAGIDVFVRDRGAGFEPEMTPEDRHGVRHSIIDRMDRHGGRAEIRSGVGEGTEVRLHLPRPQEDPPR